MKCELCKGEATHCDSAKVDLENSTQFTTAYKMQYLCLPHAIERRESNTARVFCLHKEIDAGGFCVTCGVAGAIPIDLQNFRN